MRMIEAYAVFHAVGATVTGMFAFPHYREAARRWVAELREDGTFASLVQIPIELAFGFVVFLLGVVAWPVTLVWLYDRRQQRNAFRKARDEEEVRELLEDIHRSRGDR